jgi:hypothetical protein
MRHVSLAAQSVSCTHSTHAPIAVSQTRLIDEQSRSDAHGGGGSTHTPNMHVSEGSQSAPVLHSAHVIVVVLHTSPGHSRDELHGVEVVHVPSMQTVASVQSAAREHGVVDGAPQPATAPMRTAKNVSRAWFVMKASQSGVACAQAPLTQYSPIAHA